MAEFARPLRHGRLAVPATVPSVMADSPPPLRRGRRAGPPPAPSAMPGLEPATHANTGPVAFAWIPATKGDLRSPALQEDAKAPPCLWAGMTVGGSGASLPRLQ